MSDSSLDDKLLALFPGKVVRKDLTQSIKQGANVPIFVLEYLLGMYCSTNDEATIKEGIDNVKKILSENYVRPDEKEKVKMQIRENGSYKIIDRLTASLNDKKDTYEVNFRIWESPRFPSPTCGSNSTKSSFPAASGASSPWGILSRKEAELLPECRLYQTHSTAEHGPAGPSPQENRSPRANGSMFCCARSDGAAAIQRTRQMALAFPADPFVENNVNMCELVPAEPVKAMSIKK